MWINIEGLDMWNKLRSSCTLNTVRLMTFLGLRLVGYHIFGFTTHSQTCCTLFQWIYDSSQPCCTLFQWVYGSSQPCCAFFQWAHDSSQLCCALFQWVCDSSQPCCTLFCVVRFKNFCVKTHCKSCNYRIWLLWNVYNPKPKKTELNAKGKAIVVAVKAEEERD